MKKIFIAFMMAFMMTFAAASIPVTANENGAYVEDAGDGIPTPIVAEDTPVSEPQSAPAAENRAQKQGVSFGVVLFMFILGLIINAGVSFVIANRFYKMSKKDSHLQAEIRALRRDIDEKFTGQIKEIKEKSAAVSNSNRNYSRNGGISYKAEKPSDEVSEIAKRWNIDVESEAEPDLKIRTSRRTSDSGRRSSSHRTRITNSDTKHENSNIDADADVSESVKNKAKKFLGDIFPFEED